MKHGNADGLSRLPLSISTEDNIDDVETTLFNIAQIEYLPVTAEQVQRTKEKDALLSHVLQFTKRDGQQLSMNLHWFTLTDDMKFLLWGIYVIVSEKLQKRVLDELHKDHLGIVRMKSKACSSMYGGQE